MMNKKPFIVISSSSTEADKSALVLNLAAALWADGYRVLLFAPENTDVFQFMEQRRQLSDLCHHHFIMPEIITDLTQISINSEEKSVIIADIPTAKNAQYADLFAAAHTLITVVSNCNLQNPFSAEYLNLIWNAKKQAAAKGIKYLNWVVLKYYNTENITELDYDGIEKNATRYGYRTYQLPYREAFKHIKSGYCPADMRLHKLPIKMTLSDVYARHDILKLTDFLWQHK